jgi:hypothetical protein
MRRQAKAQKEFDEAKQKEAEAEAKRVSDSSKEESGELSEAEESSGEG